MLTSSQPSTEWNAQMTLLKSGFLWRYANNLRFYVFS